MKILKSLLAIFLAILVTLCLFSCWTNWDNTKEYFVMKTDEPEYEVQETVPEESKQFEEVDGEKNYQDFLTEFEKHGLKSQGIDAEQLLADYLNDITDITEVEYEVVKCNLTGNGDKDLFLRFWIQHEWYKQDEQILYIYTLDNNNQYRNILFENHISVRGELEEILGNGRHQLVLFTDDTGNQHTRVDMKILAFYRNGNYNVVFDEVLCAYAAFPFKDVEGEHFYSVSYDNKHEFVDGGGSAKDIIFSSEIYEREDEILKTGSSRFVYNGSKYVANPYYDYHSIAKEIYDNKK